MNASTFYRIAAAVLLLLFALGHTLGFRQSDPNGELMPFLDQCGQFALMCRGSGARIGTSLWRPGFSVGVFYLFAAILAWQMGGLPAPTLALMRGTAWAFALCFAAITVVSWRYLFVLPMAFSMLITLCLTAAAWFSAKQSPLPPCDPKARGLALHYYRLRFCCTEETEWYALMVAARFAHPLSS
jgi:hypothetical protein